MRENRLSRPVLDDLRNSRGKTRVDDMEALSGGGGQHLALGADSVLEADSVEWLGLGGLSGDLVTVGQRVRRDGCAGQRDLEVCDNHGTPHYARSPRNQTGGTDDFFRDSQT